MHLTAVCFSTAVVSFSVVLPPGQPSTTLNDPPSWSPSRPAWDTRLSSDARSKLERVQGQRVSCWYDVVSSAVITPPLWGILKTSSAAPCLTPKSGCTPGACSESNPCWLLMFSDSGLEPMSSRKPPHHAPIAQRKRVRRHHAGARGFMGSCLDHGVTAVGGMDADPRIQNPLAPPLARKVAKSRRFLDLLSHQLDVPLILDILTGFLAPFCSGSLPPASFSRRPGRSCSSPARFPSPPKRSPWPQ